MPTATDQTTDPAAVAENAIPQPAQAASTGYAPGPTSVGNAPRLPPLPQARVIGGFNDPAYQKQLEAEQMDIIKRAKDVKQAEQDVAFARRTLGILKADREIASGVPPEKALYNNLHFITTPGTAAGNAAFRGMTPVPKPYGQQVNIGGQNIPAIVTPGPGGAQHTQVVPRSALPQEPFKATVEDIGDGVMAAKLGPNHYQLMERPQAKGTPSQLTKIQQKIWNDDLKALRSQKLKTPIPQEKQDLQQKIDTIERKLLQSAGEGGPESAGSEEKRIRVRSKAGKIGTIPLSHLEQALKEGYMEVR